MGATAGALSAAACRPGQEESGGPPGARGAATPEAVGERVSVDFQLDGEPKKLEVETRATLLDLLRLDLGLTGAKRVCDRGACGACMVLVDGLPHNSCMMLAADVDGSKVETVASLGEGEALGALQKAFIARDASQCGFCTPGMLVSCTALLRRGEKLDRAQVQRGIAGNLCRCGTYPHVIEAVLDASGGASEGGQPA